MEGFIGSKGLADILKPALSRGELTVIGATTQDDYRNTILKNAALARRFNEVKVNAPSAEDTFKILQRRYWRRSCSSSPGQSILQERNGSQ